MTKESQPANQNPAQWVDGLPAQQWWMPGMYGERILTPTNELGVVDVDALIDEVKTFIRPEFPWPPGADVHHAHHIHARYAEVQQRSGGEVPALDFCELPPNKVFLVRMFHSVIHATTYQPPMPAPEVMRGMVDAWMSVSALYRSVRNAVRVERERRSPDEVLPSVAMTVEELFLGRTVAHAITNHHFDSIRYWLERLHEIPEQYWPIDPTLPHMDALDRIGDTFRYGSRSRVRAVKQVTGWGERLIARSNYQPYTGTAHGDASQRAA